jgi:prepilin-type N-terminal cleavage/methylation domain-containing protein
MTFSSRTGLTLIEVVITLTLLALTAALANLAIKRVEDPDPSDPRTIIADSLAVAVREARTITVAMPTDSGLLEATLRPDGSIVADQRLEIERLIGVKTDTIKPHGRR